MVLQDAVCLCSNPCKNLGSYPKYMSSQDYIFRAYALLDLGLN